MKATETKNTGKVMINRISELVKGLEIEDAYKVAQAECEKVKDGWWIYKGGNHIALMSQGYRESERMAMFV